MNKQEQIEKLASLMADCNTTCDKCFEKLERVMTLPIQKRENYCQVYAYAQRAVEQGYRKTFTSDLASDTQKAFKEGYEKGYSDGFDDGREQAYKDCYDKTRKETAKEIAEKLKNYIRQNEIQTTFFGNKCFINEDTIDELLKEYEK